MKNCSILPPNAPHSVRKAHHARLRRRGQYLIGRPDLSPAVRAHIEKNRYARDQKRELKLAAWAGKAAALQPKQSAGHRG